MTGNAKPLPIPSPGSVDSPGRTDPPEGKKRPLRLQLSRLALPARLALTLAAVDAAIGIAVLVGWLANLPLLTSVFPGLVQTKANAAVEFVLLGTGLMTIVTSGGAPNHKAATRVRNLLVLVALAIVTATLYEHVSGVNLGIDELIAREQPGIGTPFPGRIAVPTAVAFAAAALALLLLDRSWRGNYPSEALALVVAAIGGLALLGYSYGAPELISLGSATRISLPASAGLLTFAVALIAANPNHSLARQFTDPGPGGQVARRVLPAAVVVVPFAAWLRLEGERLGLYDSELGVAITTTFEVLALLGIGAWTASRIIRVEAQRTEVRRDRDRFFAMSADLVLVTDETGRMLELSPSWETVLGRSINDIQTRPFMEFVHLDDRDATERVFLRHDDDGEDIKGFQNRYRHADGSYRWLEWVAKADRQAHRVYAIARDVTERKRAEAEANEAALYARRLIEASLDPLVTISPDGKVTDVNEATEQATGRSREELVGTDFADYFTEPELARAGYKKVLREGVVRDYALTIRHASGRTMAVLYNATVYRDRQGEQRGVFAAARDVTESLAAHARLEEYADELRRSNAELETVRLRGQPRPAGTPEDGHRIRWAASTSLLAATRIRRGRVHRLRRRGCSSHAGPHQRSPDLLASGHAGPGVRVGGSRRGSGRGARQSASLGRGDPCQRPVRGSANRQRR